MNVRSASRITSVAMVLVLVAAACASETEAPAAAPAATTAPASAGEDATEPEAPQSAALELLDFSAASADGGTINMADYAGQDLLLWFWAPW